MILSETNNMKTNRKIKLILTCVFSLIFLLGCENEKDSLVINDYLEYYESRISFSKQEYEIKDDHTAIIYTTVSNPSRIRITNYGHCWITTNGDPTIEDNPSSFGETNLTNFEIATIISDFNIWKRYYNRAYIQTEDGTMYDGTYYFNKK
jgi:hypothetical protein